MKVPPTLVKRVGLPLALLLARTWRYTLLGPGREAARDPRRSKVAFVCWHESLLPPLWLHRGEGVAIIVSEARDGQYLADFTEAIGFALLRGSSTRGGAKALLGATRALEAGGSLAITPDGPRGPRREMKPGVLSAAARAGAVVIPVHAEADRAWRLRSWDRFMIPKPFARVRMVYGTPFTVERGPAGEAAAMERVKVGMDEVVNLAQWPARAETATA